ncbi:hypothetical protein [Kitasatospora sp. NPDC059827]|uniref:hypothetical protein n=1 Tax=Kitasatospora sp. NPDC059827 TaxID=3346964 RepID=UPI003650DE69
MNPHGEPGRLAFLARLGSARVRDVLPDLVGKAAASGGLGRRPTAHRPHLRDDLLEGVGGVLRGPPRTRHPPPRRPPPGADRRGPRHTTCSRPAGPAVQPVRERTEVEELMRKPADGPRRR